MAHSAFSTPSSPFGNGPSDHQPPSLVSSPTGEAVVTGIRNKAQLDRILTLLARALGTGADGKEVADEILLAMARRLEAIDDSGPRHDVQGQGQSQSLAPWQERRAKEFMLAHLAEEVSLDEIAAVCNLSVPHFGRLFRATTGLPPYRWLREQRVLRARQLLETSDLDLSEIALVCGFANQSHFTRAFTQITGVSPGRWRRGKRA